jgi:hypothetical protein
VLCVILKVFERWAAVVDSEVMCVSKSKDRAITLWKSGNPRMRQAEIEKFVFLAYLDHRIEVLRAEDLIGRGRTYRSVKRVNPKLTEDEKDEVASALTLVRSADWAQLPPSMRAYDDACAAWWKALHTANRMAAAAGMAKSAKRARELSEDAEAAKAVEVTARGALDAARTAHLNSKAWEMRELFAYWARASAVKAGAARSRSASRARVQGKKLDATAGLEAERLQERATSLMKNLRDEDDASRGFRSLGPVWRPFTM